MPLGDPTANMPILAYVLILEEGTDIPLVSNIDDSCIKVVISWAPASMGVKCYDKS